jgi:hypothetical protein
VIPALPLLTIRASYFFAEKRTMAQPARTQIVRLALIEGIVIALGIGLLGLLGVVACLIDPQLVPTSFTPPSH